MPKDEDPTEANHSHQQTAYKEQPFGSNCNKFSHYFDKRCQAWCADFVSWAFDSTGNRDKRVAWRNPSAVASIFQWAKRTNMVERALGIDSTQAASPDNQAEEDIQQTEPTLAPTEETAPTPVNSAEEQPTSQSADPQPTYPPAYPSPSIPAYPQPTYPQPTYPPAYPSPSIPAYPQPTYPPAYQSPINAMSVYVLPQAYPPHPYLSPPPNRTPVIINNF